MGLWRWIRRTVADPGHNRPVPIFLEQGSRGQGYVFRLGVRAGIDGSQIARVPVSRRLNPDRHPLLKEIHSCEVMGRKLEAGNIYALKNKVAAQLETIAPARRLPICYFRVAAADYELPVYEQEGKFVSGLLGGPHLKESDLSAVYREICRYLVSAGYIRDPSQVDVGIVRARDLTRVDPAAVFRSLANSGVWLPAVDGASDEGPVVGLVDRAARLSTEQEGGERLLRPGSDYSSAAPDIIGLLGLLRGEVGRDSFTDPDDLYASAVRPDIWEAAFERTSSAGSLLVACMTDRYATRLELPVCRAGAAELATALVDREINVFSAADEQSLARAVGRYLHMHGFLRFADEVEVKGLDQVQTGQLEREDAWPRDDLDPPQALASRRRFHRDETSVGHHRGRPRERW